MCSANRLQGEMVASAVKQQSATESEFFSIAHTVYCRQFIDHCCYGRALTSRVKHRPQAVRVGRGAVIPCHRVMCQRYFNKANIELFQHATTTKQSYLACAIFSACSTGSEPSRGLAPRCPSPTTRALAQSQTISITWKYEQEAK